jgi:hypothetical protein
MGPEDAPTRHYNQHVGSVLGDSMGKNYNSVAVVRKRTIPTERPPLVGEVSAKRCG